MSMWQRVSMRRVEFGLLLLGALIMAVTVVNLELSQGNELSSSVLWVIGGYFGVFSIAHLALCFLAPYADQLMLPVAALLNGLGLIMINRLDVARGTSMAPKQVMWALVAIVLMIVVLLVVRDYRTLSRYSFLLGLVGLVLLALPMVWPSGTNADAKLWISIGPFSLQPGEFSKILLLLFFAQLLVNKRALFQVAGARFWVWSSRGSAIWLRFWACGQWHCSSWLEKTTSVPHCCCSAQCWACCTWPRAAHRG